MSADPFDLLIEIEKKCRTYGRPLPRQRMAGKVWQGVGYQSSLINFVTALHEIVEVATFPVLTVPPASASWFLGVANLRGQLLPITDLQCFITGTRQSITPHSRILVINFEQTGAGFLVNRVFGVQRFFEDELKQKNEALSEQYQEYSEGFFEQSGDQWNVLSLQNLTKKTEFYHVIQENI